MGLDVAMLRAVYGTRMISGYSGSAEIPTEEMYE